MEYKGFGDLNRKKDVDLEKRKFLKKSAIGVLGVVASWKALDKAIDLFSEEVEEEKEKEEGAVENNEENIVSERDENEIEIKEPTTEKPENVSEAIKPEQKSSKAEKENLVEKILNPEEMAEEMLRVYNLPVVQRRYDRDIFTKDFFIAQQFQESRGRMDAESESGAKGVYQNKPDSVIEVVRYMAFLREETKDLPAGERCDYVGQNDISENESEKITDLFVEKINYGRAAGKLYLLSIHDKDSKYNDGDPNEDVFRSKSVERQQELLLMAYHDGPSRRNTPQNASLNAKKYLRLVKEKMNIIADIRKRLERAEMSKDLDYAILHILRKLDDEENHNKTDKAVSYWLKKLQERHIEKWRQDNKFGKPLDDSEVSLLFEKK